MSPLLLHQLGELLLNAVPTIIIFLIVWMAYELLIQKPLGRILHQRQEMTIGAITRAQADVAAADTKAKDYEERLRQARLEAYRRQEESRKQWMDARMKAVAEARAVSEAKVQAARAEIAKETEAAKAGLGSQAEAMANEVIRAVLKPAQPAPAATR